MRGTWASIVYTQYGNLPLLQVVSVTGLWGITFLIAWFASTCNWLWDAGVNCKPAVQGMGICLGTIGAAMLLGGARMALFPAKSPTVRIASISKRDVKLELSDEIVARLLAGKPTTEDLTAIREWSGPTDDDLLIRAERELQAGAKIVFWGEGNATVLKADESALIARGASLAAHYQAYVGMALTVLRTSGSPSVENKLVLLQPDGQVAWEYNKARPVPGPEAAMQVRGDGRLRALDTPYGRLTAIICFDGDFPDLLAQAGASRADLVLDPSNDWRAIDPWHTQMASFRAIEQGTNLVRQTSRGLSGAFDYHGRQLSAMDHYQTSDYAMVSDVPTKGVRTLYSRLGDWFGWLCMAGFACLLVTALRSRK